jgi:hypothetical protein
VTLRRLAVTAFEHMGLEERLVLPLVERHIFATEWEAMEQQAVASMAPEEAMMAVGMVMYEVDRQSLPVDGSHAGTRTRGAGGPAIAGPPAALALAADHPVPVGAAERGQVRLAELRAQRLERGHLVRAEPPHARRVRVGAPQRRGR